MSTWLPDSTISQFNQLQDERWFVLPPDFATVLREAIELHGITQGGLDVSLGTLVNRWGFGPTPRAADPAASTSEARGMAQLELAEESGMWFVRKKQPQLQLDLSAIAKGYGVDALVAVLDAADISDYLVEIGGELRGRGLNPLQQPWRVGIEHPQAREQHVAVVALDGLALALHILTALPLLASAAPYQQGTSATATVDAGEHVVKHDTITAAKKKDGTFDR